MNDSEFISSLLKERYSKSQKDAIVSEFFKRSQNMKEPDFAFLYAHMEGKLNKYNKKRLKRIFDSTEYVNLNTVTDQQTVIDKIQTARDRGHNIILSGSGNHVNLVGRDFIRGPVPQAAVPDMQRRARNIGEEILRTAGATLGSKILQAIGNSIFPGLGTLGSTVIPSVASFFKRNRVQTVTDPEIINENEIIRPVQGRSGQSIVDNYEEPKIPNFLGFKPVRKAEEVKYDYDETQSVYNPSEFEGYSVFDEAELAPPEVLNEDQTREANSTIGLLNTFLEGLPDFQGASDFNISPFILKTAVNAGLSWALNNYSKR